MSRDGAYVSVLTSASAEYIDRKSQFIGYAKPVKTKEEALEFIAEIRKNVPDLGQFIIIYFVILCLETGGKLC